MIHKNDALSRANRLAETSVDGRTGKPALRDAVRDEVAPAPVSDDLARAQAVISAYKQFVSHLLQAERRTKAELEEARVEIGTLKSQLLTQILKNTELLTERITPDYLKPMITVEPAITEKQPSRKIVSGTIRLAEFNPRPIKE
ncbi:MAG: hypothetical protein CME36_09605 [unclassified Hahellaceae]|nr:hypothetical protein [Hahellaceae bacterium]|tara:strand:+ start:25509 stop:25940 length:432 start_codon:yes stop_codon:yes gene_type:complete